MLCDACRGSREGAFYVVDGEQWCATCVDRQAAQRPSPLQGLVGGALAGLAAAALAVAIVGMLPQEVASLNLLNVWAVPIGLAVGGAVRIGRRRYAPTRWLPVMATGLAYATVALCLLYGLVNTSLDGGPISMVTVVSRLFQPSIEGWVLMPLLPIVFGVQTVFGALSLCAGLGVTWRASRGTPVQVDGPFVATAG